MSDLVGKPLDKELIRRKLSSLYALDRFEIDRLHADRGGGSHRPASSTCAARAGVRTTCASASISKTTSRATAVTTRRCASSRPS